MNKYIASVIVLVGFQIAHCSLETELGDLKNRLTTLHNYLTPGIPPTIPVSVQPEKPIISLKICDKQVTPEALNDLFHKGCAEFALIEDAVTRLILNSDYLPDYVKGEASDQRIITRILIRILEILEIIDDHIPPLYNTIKAMAAYNTSDAPLSTTQPIRKFLKKIYRAAKRIHGAGDKLRAIPQPKTSYSLIPKSFSDENEQLRNAIVNYPLMKELQRTTYAGGKPAIGKTILDFIIYHARMWDRRRVKARALQIGGGAVDVDVIRDFPN